MKNRHLLKSFTIGLSIYFLFAPICSLLASETAIHFKRLSVNDGLSQNTVLALTQDHNSKIWVGPVRLIL